MTTTTSIPPKEWPLWLQEKMERTDIVWMPHEAEEGYCIPAPPLTTFGTGRHVGGPDLVYVPGITGPEFYDDGDRNPWGLDPEIAGLIIALNEAGIKTVQSCQDITSYADEDNIYDDVPRMGIVLVEWDTFPLMKDMFPEAATGTNFDDGWLFATSRDADYVSILFPWRDLDKFTAAVKAPGSHRAVPAIPD